MSKVASYKEVYRMLLLCYPDYCRAKIRKKNKWGGAWVENELEVGYALDEMRDSFKHPVENLMLYTSGLILAAGRESEFTHDIFLEKIKQLISEHGLDSLLGEVSDADSADIKSDLEVLRVI